MGVVTGYSVTENLFSSRRRRGDGDQRRRHISQADAGAASGNMLVLNCDVDQGLVINTNVRVIVLGVRGKRVKLGILAPDDVPVHRDVIARELHAAGRRFIDRRNGS